jgi:hypothetical protein
VHVEHVHDGLHCVLVRPLRGQPRGVVALRHLVRFFAFGAVQKGAYGGVPVVLGCVDVAGSALPEVRMMGKEVAVRLPQGPLGCAEGPRRTNA